MGTQTLGCAHKFLSRMGACSPAKKHVCDFLWARQRSLELTPEAVNAWWQECERVDWMLWCLARTVGPTYAMKTYARESAVLRLTFVVTADEAWESGYARAEQLRLERIGWHFVTPLLLQWLRARIGVIVNGKEAADRIRLGVPDLWEWLKDYTRKAQ